MSWWSDGEKFDEYDPPYCEKCNRVFSKAVCDACQAQRNEMERLSKGQMCETCVFYIWDAEKEVSYCDNSNSKWDGVEVSEEYWCEEWEDA